MPHSSKRRDIGVAISIPEPYTSELQGWRERLGDPNAADIPPHVTLVPPTSLSTDDLEAVEQHLLEAASHMEGFVIHLRGSGTFRPVSPVVFVPLAQGISECEQLEALVRRGPLERELSFPYHPHVTVAHDVSEDLLDQAFAELTTYDARFRVWGFSLFEKGRDDVWRPQRDFPFHAPLPGPVLPPDEVG
jgi:2'-5' RNA ligase